MDKFLIRKSLIPQDSSPTQEKWGEHPKKYSWSPPTTLRCKICKQFEHNKTCERAHVIGSQSRAKSIRVSNINVIFGLAI